MQRRNLLQTWVDGAAYFGLFLRVRRIIAVVSVADEMILQAQRVDGFRQARRERHDALDWLGNANCAAQIIRDFPIGRRRGRDRRSALGPRDLRAEQRSNNCSREYVSKEHSCEPFQGFPLARKFHFTNKKAPRDTLGPVATFFLAKSAAFCGTGRVAWLTAFQPITVAGPRPIHTAFPASLACKLKIECMPRLRECQCTAANLKTERQETENSESVQRFFQLGLRFSTKARRPS